MQHMSGVPPDRTGSRSTHLRPKLHIVACARALQQPPRTATRARAARGPTSLRPRAPGPARAHPRGRLRAARVAHRLRPPVRLLDRRGVALHEPGRGDVLAGPGSRLLPEPGGLHVPGLPAPAGAVRAARLHVRPAVWQRHRAVRQGPDRDLDRRPHALRRPLHGRRGSDLLGRAPAVGCAGGARRGGRARVRVPARCVFAGGRHGRGCADRGGACSDVGGPGVRRGTAARLCAGRRRRRAGRRLQVHGGPGAAAASDRRPGATPPGPPPRRGRTRARCGARGRRVRCPEPIRARVARRLVEGPARAGRGRRRPAQAGPGVGRRLLLPRQPHLGARLGRRRGGARRRRDRAAPEPRARAAAGGCPGGAVRLPDRAVPLLRALAAAGLSGALLALLTGLALAQPLAADVRSAIVLGREDTRNQARDWLVKRFPPELRVSIEPAVPGRWFRSNPEGKLPSWLSRCPRREDWTEAGWSYVAGGGRRVCAQYKPGLFTRPDGGVRASAYHLVLSPGVIDDYRRYGYCLVTTVDVVRERALDTGDPRVRGYYRRLERESRLLREFSPYDKGAKPVPFSFDLSYNYYPPEYHRPGPTVRIYRLNRCTQRSGPPLIRIPKAREPVPFAPPQRDRGAPQEET